MLSGRVVSLVTFVVQICSCFVCIQTVTEWPHFLGWPTMASEYVSNTDMLLNCLCSARKHQKLAVSTRQLLVTPGLVTSTRKLPDTGLFCLPFFMSCHHEVRQTAEKRGVIWQRQGSWLQMEPLRPCGFQNTQKMNSSETECLPPVALAHSLVPHKYMEISCGWIKAMKRSSKLKGRINVLSHSNPPRSPLAFYLTFLN